MPPTDQKTRIDRRALIDLGVRALLAVIFAAAASGYFKNAFGQLADSGLAHGDMRTLSGALSIISVGFYFFMVACLYVLRLRPVNPAAGWLPRAAGLLGGFLLSGLLLLTPCLDLPLTLEITANILILTGNGLAVFILTRLGRSFSIIPEARKLVTTGPYGVVRHPLYVAEAIAALGVLISFWSLPAAVLVAVQLALQLARINYEERVLRQVFPEYEDYAKRTARLIPGVY